jgi:hypothetical protein
LPEGPFHTAMLVGLLNNNGKQTISKQEMMEVLTICKVSNPDHMVCTIGDEVDLVQCGEVGLVVPARQEIPTGHEFDNLNLEEAMFERVLDDCEVDVAQDMDMVDEESEETMEVEVSPVVVTPTAASEINGEVGFDKPDLTERKRKERGCAHENYFCRESYSELTTKAYFTPSYMKERMDPVHFCTGIKIDGSKCGVDFTNPDFKITTSQPVRACFHAVKIDTECVHALCNACFIQAQNKNMAQQSRPSRRRPVSNIGSADENTNRYAEI